jgi:hypothetical protein
VFLEVHYNSVTAVSVQASHRLEIIEDSGLIHTFTSFGSVTAELIIFDTHKLVARGQQENELAYDK